MIDSVSVPELIKKASMLESKQFDKLYDQLSELRIKKRKISKASKPESDLLLKLDIEFPAELFERLQYLNWKIENSSPNQSEMRESLKLAAEYEAFSHNRIKIAIKLSKINGQSVEKILKSL